MTASEIAEILRPYILAPVPEGRPAGDRQAPAMAGLEELAEPLARFLDLLLRWNARTNLTAICNPEEIVRRHFGESLFAARVLQPWVGASDAILDFGSGAGFPGIPLQMLLPSLRVTLAESQNKKAAFLREAIRMLGLPSEVWAARVEAMPVERKFAAVTLRAVDRMQDALAEAARRATTSGVVLSLEGEAAAPPDAATGGGVESVELVSVRLPGAEQSFVRLRRVL